MTKIEHIWDTNDEPENSWCLACTQSLSVYGGASCQADDLSRQQAVERLELAGQQREASREQLRQQQVEQLLAGKGNKNTFVTVEIALSAIDTVRKERVAAHAQLAALAEAVRGARADLADARAFQADDRLRQAIEDSDPSLYKKENYVAPVLITDGIENIGEISVLSAAADISLEEAFKTGRIKIERTTERITTLLANESKLLIRVRKEGFRQFEITANVKSGSQIRSIMTEDIILPTEEELAARNVEEGDDF